MHILLLVVLKFMTTMVRSQESFSAEIHGDLMNGRETGVIILVNGLSNLDSKLDL